MSRKRKLEDTSAGSAKKPATSLASWTTVEDFNITRCRQLNDMHIEPFKGPVLYWMSRDQRVQDNWALIFAQKLANKVRVPLCVCFCLVSSFLGATIRHYGFMLKGLQEELRSLQIPFYLLCGTAKQQIPLFTSQHKVSAVVCDFAPLRVPLQWSKDVAGELKKQGLPLIQVDSHNIVPVWEASDKQEYAARTIRSKLHKKLPEYLEEFPLVEKHLHKQDIPPSTDWQKAFASLRVDKSVGEVSWATPGTRAGLKKLEEFCDKRLKQFDAKRNDPTSDSLSGLSPWLHFGQVSTQRCIMRVSSHKGSSVAASVASFVEEAFVRRELSENFCFYNNNYDSINGAADWARATLQVHCKDKRDHVYTLEQFENARTHDDLWNAAQLQMVNEGKMHGFLRMYWAKKILEWSSSPQKALEIAIYLNDRYELDGRDPNGYVGCIWSICGVHDQGWSERPVFGKIRYMNYAGCCRKFDVKKFVARYPGSKTTKSK
ncbi:deoxyribodipyrimidine photo-lyase-like isoform X2 [Dysidea avara]|uniref:deoxyribodipyrimidine photo-lyase-like isoform X2 n=1 Tax=Dysidea avara TaxID=196820 RepID=UPI0033276457